MRPTGAVSTPANAANPAEILSSALSTNVSLMNGDSALMMWAPRPPPA
jgi:hypothetical protein